MKRAGQSDESDEVKLHKLPPAPAPTLAPYPERMYTFTNVSNFKELLNH